MINKKQNKKLIYLASPYSASKKEIEQKRFEQVCKVAAILMQQGYNIFSPIAHTHPIAVFGNMPKDFSYWQQYDNLILSKCDGLLILTITNWHKSKGIKSEIELAYKLNKSIKYVDIKGNITEKRKIK